MLVRDLERRMKVPSILKHRWLNNEHTADILAKSSAELGDLSSSLGDSSSNLGDLSSRGRKCEEQINEGLLKIMGDLGIDTSVTREVSLYMLQCPSEKLTESAFSTLLRIDSSDNIELLHEC